MTRIRTIIAVGLITAGVVTMAGPTFGFSSLAADRGVQAATVDDPGAYLGVVDNSGSADANIRNKNSESLLYYLNDNADVFSSASVVTADVTAFNGETTGLSARVEADSGSNDYVVIVDCGNSDRKGDGTVTVNLVANGDIRVELERTTAETVSVKCRGGQSNGPANFQAGDVNADGPIQRFRFNVDALKNKDYATIDLSEAQQNSGVNYKGATARIVSGHDSRSFGFDDETSEITYQASGNVGGTLEIEITGFEIKGDQAGTVYYSDDQGRTSSDTFSVPTVVENEGDVTTDGDVVVKDGGTANDIDAGGDVQTGQNANINGEITAGGGVSMESGSTSGSINAGGSVTVDDTNVNGEITAGRDVTLRSGTTVNGVDAGGTVTIESSVSVNGAIIADGDVHVGDGINLPDVNSGGTVYIGCNVNENGEINAEEVVYEC